MKGHNATRRYVICISNEGYPASLEVRKVYRVLPDSVASRHGMIRVVDESGSDYLYPVRYFVPIALPRAAEKSLAAG